MQASQTATASDKIGFFGADYLLVHGASLSAEETLRQVEFLERVLELEPGTRILDVPCGQGRHAIALAKRGYDVVGLDLNQLFLQTAQEQARRDAVDIRFLEADMRQIPFSGEFDIALNLFTSLGYFDDDADDQKVVSGIARALKPGGKFLLDFINRDAFVRNFRPRWERDLADGSRLITMPRYDPLPGRTVTRHFILEEGVEREISSLAYRMYSAAELSKMGTEAGLAVSGAYGDFEGGDLTMESKRAILVFSKKS